MARLLTGREKRADRAHRAPQLAFGLAESGTGALRVETDEQVTLFHILGFLIKDLDDDARRVGIHRDEIAGDECIVGHDPETAVEPPIDGIGQSARGQHKYDEQKQKIAAAADCLAINLHGRVKRYP